MEDEWSADSSRNVTAHGDARLGKWRGNWRMEWVASTLHTTSEHGASSITTADAHTSAASSRLNWQPCWFKWTRPFRRKTKSGFCACAITFQLVSTTPKSLYSGGGRRSRYPLNTRLWATEPLVRTIPKREEYHSAAWIRKTILQLSILQPWR